MNMFMCLRVNMGKFEVQIEGCMAYIAFWDNLSPNGLVGQPRPYMRILI